ncbi:MAG: CinA family nicotinamide mononucleotide deamidase-related protein [Deltaproteobacteria bacterium]|nr:MAG: CinA family nicotinamide mononucleotide deamidase-related protein [Deltaproteobacteria bacterium]
MNCEIVTIGNELLLGQIIDTNASYLARKLNLIGINITFHTTVGDDYPQIRDVLSQALKRADLVITTGGIGPTEDDLTREVVADLVGAQLIFKEELMEQIESIFTRLGYRMPENNKKQAFIPDGAISIPNEIGTAPGFIIQKGSSLIVALPGVPKELKYLLNNQVIPYLKRHFHLDGELITSRVLKVTGIGESKVDSRIKDLITPNTNPSVGIMASPGDISITITAYAKNAKKAEDLIRPIEQEIRSRLGINIYGTNDDTLDMVVTNLLNKRGDTLSVIENFSGGQLTARLQRSPLSPLKEGIVIGKRERIPPFLDRKTPTINKEIAETLAKRIRDKGNSSIGLALIGTLKATERGYEVDAQVVVSGEDVSRSYDWKMGGDIPTLQGRAATIALNTLRLALIS